MASTSRPAKVPAGTPTSATAAALALSAIDAIFAGKGFGGGAPGTVVGGQAEDLAEKRRKKRKKGVGKEGQDGDKDTEASSQKDAAAAVEVVDPSAAIEAAATEAGRGKRARETDEEELAFRDSRGTRSKTEDGLYIYSVEELKIGLGGGTPLCPFDCDCCF